MKIKVHMYMYLMRYRNMYMSSFMRLYVYSSTCSKDERYIQL